MPLSVLCRPARSDSGTCGRLPRYDEDESRRMKARPIWIGENGVSIYALKPKFQALLRPLTAALARSGVTANQITLAAAVVSAALGVFIAYRAPERWPFL